jgi:hypothetical protein
MGLKNTCRFLLAGLLFFSILNCNRQPAVKNMKDLDENMMDIRVYQENLGDHVRTGKLTDAQWLLTGMDSILRLMSDKFTEHRKLPDGFSYYYKKRMKNPIRGIQKGIDRNDTALARRNYRILVRNCNSCHVDHDIDKVVKY